ncbi:MAG: PA2778 family cysteine peptidase [Pseudomonadota bacterium]
MAWRVALATLVLLSGCSVVPTVPGTSSIGASIQELSEVPFYPQDAYQCGPAALASVLTYSGIARSPEDLVDAVYVPARQGSLQAEMIAAARSHGRMVYPVQTPEEIQAQLRNGTPVLVFQNLGLPQYPRWHYAVVVGWNPGREVILRSGTTRRLVLNETTFLRTWQWGGAWAQVILPPDRLPASAEFRRYLSSALDLESVDQPAAALSAYQAAARHWPDQDLAWLAWSNLLLQTQGPTAARDALEVLNQGLSRNPNSEVLRLNQAGILLTLGKREEAQLAARDIASREGPWQKQAVGLLHRIEAGEAP